MSRPPPPPQSRAPDPGGDGRGQDPYGGVAREDRIGDGYCDKAWHLSGEPVPATVVLTCAWCGRRYARCAPCNHGKDSAQTNMRAHVSRCSVIRRRRS